MAKISRGLHSGFSEPEFMDHVAAAKSFGVPAFFNEPGLADGHVLVWTELDHKGNRLVRGEASVRSIASDKVTGWINAHSGDASSMVPQGEVGFHAAIQSAALYIDKHNMVMKNYDYTGPETAKAMAGMADAKAQLTQRLADAQHALTLGPSSSVYQQVAKDYGDPASVVSMAQFYLAQIETAENAKAAGVGTPLSPGQFPGWEATEHTAIGGGVKITYKKAKRALGTSSGDITEDTWSLGKDDGELHLQAGQDGGVSRLRLAGGAAHGRGHRDQRRRQDADTQGAHWHDQVHLGHRGRQCLPGADPGVPAARRAGDGGG